MDRFDDWFDDNRTELEPKDNRTAFCRKAAEQLLKRHAITNAPVPVGDIAKALGITVRLATLPSGLDARLLIASTDKLLEVSSDAPRVRRRFSIAHELGHLTLGHAHDDGHLAERQANIFAGALLVPRGWLARDTKTATTLDALARRYEVSTAVMSIALTEAKFLNRVQ